MAFATPVSLDCFALAVALDRAEPGKKAIMRYRFHHIEDAPKDQVEEHVRQKAGYLETRLATFEDDLVRLDMRLSHHVKRYPNRRDSSSFTSHLVLDLPGRKLPNIGADGHGESWTTAVNEAFDVLEAQLDKTLAKLHREPAIHAYQHRPSWERDGAELLGNPQPTADDVDRPSGMPGGEQES